jgi:hypothetical protein
MKISQGLINEIVKKAFSIRLLEDQFNKIQKSLDSGKKVEQLSIKELQTLLAYHYLKDGAERDFVETVWKNKDPAFKTKIDLLKELKKFD